MSERNYVFLHIPRSFGSITRWLLRENLENSKYEKLNVNEPNYFHGEILNFKYKNDKVNLYLGHVPYALLPVFISKDDFKLALLMRHPIERVASHINFINRNPTHFLHKKFKDKSLKQILNMKVINNFQTRYLGFFPKSFNMSNRLTIVQEFESLKIPDFSIPSLIAYDVIDTEIDFLATSRNFNSFLKDILEDIGIDTEITANDASRNKIETIKEGTRDLIESNNRFDMVLYRYVMCKEKSHVPIQEK